VEKSIIGAALRDAVFLSLDFDLLFVWIFLRVMVHVPAERDQKLVNEVAPGFGFLILRREIELLVGLEFSGQFFHPLKSVLEVCWHPGRD